LIVRFGYREEWINIIRAIPGQCWDFHEKARHFSNTSHNMSVLMKSFGDRIDFIGTKTSESCQYLNQPSVENKKSEKVLELLRDYYKEYRPSIRMFEGQKGGKYSSKSVQKIFRITLL